MLSRRYRRLLQRRLRRRPLLPFLLAATVAFDGAIIASSYDLSDVTGNEFLGMFVLGIVVGQLGLLGIWIASAWQGLALRLGIAVLASQGVAFVLARPFVIDKMDDLSVMSAVSIFLLAATAIAAAMTRFLFNFFGGHGRRFVFSFSVGTLLLLTTVVAVAIVIVQQGTWSFLVDLGVLFLSIDAMIPAAIWLACKQSRFWLSTVGVIITISLALVASYWLLGNESDLGMAFHYGGQIGIVLIWLLALRSRRLPPVPFQLRLIGEHEEAAPENPERPLERHQVAELKEINVVV